MQAQALSSQLGIARMQEAGQDARSQRFLTSQQAAQAENVRAALSLVSRGEAPFGIAYATDAHSDRGVRVVDTFPASTYPPIVYPAALTAFSKSPAAKPLLDYLRSANARPLWEKHGFGVVP